MNVRLIRRIVSGVGLPYVVMSWSKVSFGSIVEFHPTVLGDPAGAVL